eukprot:6206880-Pleurochrysis_carterae.AAC.6
MSGATSHRLAITLAEFAPHSQSTGPSLPFYFWHAHLPQLAEAIAPNLPRLLEQRDGVACVLMYPAR